MPLEPLEPLPVVILGIGSRVRHPEFGEGVVVGVKPETYSVTFIKSGRKEIAVSFPFEVIEAVDTPRDMFSVADMEKLLTNILRKYSDLSEPVALGDKWMGGKMVLTSKDGSLAPKEIPIETFFHKIVMIRDRMRTLEQRVNAAKGLNDEEKINIQQYITRIYGSLTTFNVLFKYKEDHFVGEKGD